MNVLEKDRQLAEKIMGFGALCLRQARLEWVNEQFDEAERWTSVVKKNGQTKNRLS